ncbi:MAG: UDP-N-acetylglucosamine 1-carboxyvinyltransferase [Puniceicoccales bacterium]|jgi:UDP-N-acetylglucosamine 1-carboxyvinyltransferase|nr:UDP-N-acetylglucosamine 1-carboxyvinyltransferase [Puniceicoccales bacterium]
MSSVRIVGGRPLSGEVAVGGAKNGGLPILAATLLTDDPVAIDNLPQLEDIRTMVTILRGLGGEISQREDITQICMKGFSGDPDGEAVSRMRASVCLLGPLVARHGRAVLPLPGGCAIGPRPIDLHLYGLQKLGCEIALRNGLIHVSAKRLRGTRLFLGGRHGSTVTGTANILCAAVLAKGTTEIQCAACEPEVADLCHFLQKMGAKISGIGSPILTVEGVDGLHGTRHRLIPDRIQLGTFALLAPLARGDFLLSPADPSHCGALLEAFDRMAVPTELGPNFIRVLGSRCHLGPMDLTTLPYPGFPTDLQAAMCVLMTQAEGISIITERVYPHRFAHLGELERMGAAIALEGQSAIVKGPSGLRGASIAAADLRGGACLYLAALIAEGESTVRNVQYVDRGYENFEEKLRRLGAQIERIG